MYIPTMPKAVAAVQAASREPVVLSFVRDAGHHLYADNPEGFHRLVERALAGPTRE